MTPPFIVQDNVQLIAVGVKGNIKPNNPVELTRRRQAKLFNAAARRRVTRGFS